MSNKQTVFFIVQEENQIKFTNSFGTTVKANASLHWMVRNLLYYGNVCLNTEIVLKYKEKGIEKFFEDVFEVPVTLRRGPMIGSHNQSELNQTFFVEMAYENEMKVKERFLKNINFRSQMINYYGVDNDYLPGYVPPRQEKNYF